MRKALTSFLIFLSVLLIFSAKEVSAKVISDQKGMVDVGKTEVINDDLFIGAQAVDLEGTVNGDVFIGAQSVKITGNVNGNLHVGANTIDLSGNVKGKVYAGAQNIIVSGSTIGGSLLVGGATVNVDKNSSIGGSILAGAGILSLDSQVKRSVYAGTGSLTIGSDTKIGKDLYYASGKNEGQVNISSDAKILGTVHKSEINTPQKTAVPEIAKKKVSAVVGTVKVVSMIFSLIGALIVGFLYFKLFNKHFTETANIVKKSFWKSLGIGFLVTITLIPGLIILLVTVIGIPLAGLALLVFLLYSYLAKIVVGSALGNWLSEKINWKMSNYGAFAFGLLTIYILRSIPFVGFLIGLVVLWVGLGALTLRSFSKSS